MKSKPRKFAKTTLSDRIADALTVKPGADIEDDQVFGTKPHTVSRNDLSSSDSEIDAKISDFRKRNVNLLSDLSKKYEGEVVSRKELEENNHEDSDSDSDHNLLTVQDLLLNGDTDSSDDGGATTNQSPSQQKQKNQTEPKTNGIDLSKINFEDDPKQSPSNKVSTKTTVDSIQSSDDSDSGDRINKILKSIGASDKTPTSKSIETASESGSSSNESDDYSISKFQKEFNTTKQKPKKKVSIQSIKSNLEDQSSDGSESESNSIDQGEESDSGEEDEEEGFDISEMQEPVQEEFEHVKKQNISEEAKKGACVRNQLLLWEGLLEMRIHLQRCMNTANQMPMPESYEELKHNDKFAEECNATKANVASVLDKFLTLQNLLLKSNPETKSLCNSKKQGEAPKQDTNDDEEIPSDTDNEEIPSDTDDDTHKHDAKHDNNTITSTRKRKLQDYESELSKSHKSFKTFRDSTIKKWNDKTRLATSTNMKNTTTNTILQQISYILSDKEKLVRRTQLKRSEYDIVGYKSSSPEKQNEELPTTKDRKDDDEYISEIFDDSDFYHQLLRELIECKSADISDPVQLSRQWIALQQMRSKMKRRVDTKATKGRKIKYVVHNPLVNYMAPEKSTTWTDESTNELYSSLFGKMFEHNNVGLNANLENGFKIKN